ncbi:MAG: aldehyde dehydrogenase family protein [Balneolaceae bacterium]|nr:aldehyde dehydrogenase family protein [Balneolaceae bacterium]
MAHRAEGDAGGFGESHARNPGDGRQIARHRAPQLPAGPGGPAHHDRQALQRGTDLRGAGLPAAAARPGRRLRTGGARSREPPLPPARGPIRLYPHPSARALPEPPARGGEGAGARCPCGTHQPGRGGVHARNGVFPPTLLFDPDPETRLMQEEIFGPVLPVVPYDSLEEALDFVNARPHPLALYYFDRNRKRRECVLQETRSGGVTFNDCIFHLVQHNLPFGGVGPSGMGSYHGFDGFRTLRTNAPSCTREG